LINQQQRNNIEKLVGDDKLQANKVWHSKSTTCYPNLMMINLIH
jgi:hypothetical protein